MKTLRQARESFPLSRRILLLVAFTLLAANALPSSAKPQAQNKTAPLNAATISDALRKSFGSAIEATTAFKPYYLTGDFNGDGAQDILIVVRIKGSRSELAPDVKIYNPFERPKAIYPEDPAANPTLALALIHGSRLGWQTTPALEKFLLFGQSPILILNYSRAASSEASDQKGLMELLPRRSTKYRGDSWPPATAKGDSIVLGTEATDSILYWNGKTYRWEEAAGGD
ncbi:MAG TPA: hypothetical protein VGO56_21570 [Pyrinomonadaceae bacterium]|jgi:hypothetical protein|nr:hypothetical protein [Pyrinomonadaceae bacterium]